VSGRHQIPVICAHPDRVRAAGSQSPGSGDDRSPAW
jgi:hypothetical protein